MKKTVLLLVFCTIQSGLLLGQINKGKILIGLSTSLNVAGTEENTTSIGFSKRVIKGDDDSSSSSGNESKSFGLNFSPKIGYFVANNFVVGLLSNYSFSNTKYDDDKITFIINQYSFGPFLRYYIPTKNILPFLEFGSSFGKTNSMVKIDYNNSEIEGNIRESMISAGIGMAVPLGKKVNFDLLLGYENHVSKRKENNDNNEKEISHIIGLDLGFTVILGKNK
ncbi:outer membrane beta-barrel protein [Flexithrix dorotheae]|uniref:outer membrane beta-barrel protein n=1 Tax=Flexithrix dorotheae TaxID=70993 RepID=UPI00037B5D1F|nr:outer membrane beta-barrel protein [Flexithrix dorotheae]